MQNELMHWFGEYAEQLEIMGGGNLLYNMAAMVRSGIGIVITPMLECSYEGLRFGASASGDTERDRAGLEKGTDVFCSCEKIYRVYQEKRFLKKMRHSVTNHNKKLPGVSSFFILQETSRETGTGTAASGVSRRNPSA